ncbi:MAG: FmdB family zinc ribbon protein [Candidatus Omnitrophota bacterium]
MPTYEYECDKCKHKFDAFQTMTAKPIKKCPECGGKVTRLLGTGAGIIFKGSGFYQTDYKKSHSHTGGSEKSCDKSKSDGCKCCPKNKDK